VRVLLILGHPRSDSFGAALCEALRQGIADAGLEHRTLAVAALAFDPDVRQPSPADQALEPDLQEAQGAIAWADHLVFVYPTWWGTLPARLKGFLDRVLTPGFAFSYRPGTEGWDPLLAGKTAELMTTMDTPGWVYRWIYAAPGYRAMARATLGFCGVRTVHISRFGPVHRSTRDQRDRWLREARARGRSLAAGPRPPLRRGMFKLGAWLRALRLQFYPMTWMVYAAGALLATSGARSLDAGLFWVGYLALFALEAATVFSNEYFDFETDRRNPNAGPFNGGSRVLVDGSLSRAELRTGIAAALLVFLFACVWLLTSMADARVSAAGVLLVLAVLALGYTVPPLRLSYRGLGELDVAVTHSIGVLLAGYVFQGGVWTDPPPWLLALPLALAVLPAIVLSGIPDRESDAAAGKRTLAVRLGVRGAVALAGGAAFAATAAAIFLVGGGWDAGVYAGVVCLAGVHALLLAAILGRRLRQDRRWARIDGPTALALTFMLWFGAAPLVLLS